MASAEKKVCLDTVSSNNDIETQANPTRKSSFSSNPRLLNDRPQFLSVFPEEVWKLIFSKVEDPKGLECLSNYSLFLRDLLAPQRVQFLFPTVLEIMGGYDHVDENALSLLMELDICPLKLRSVCQSWNKTIDNLIDNHPFHFYLQRDARKQQNSWWQCKFAKIVAANKIFSEGTDLHVLLLNHFDRSHGNADRNPILGRSIKIQFDYVHEEEIIENFLPAVRSVLQKYGMHIYYCTVSVNDTPVSDSVLYSVINKFLQVMPNLKVFKYIVDTTFPNGSENELLEELSAEVNCNPLPTLFSLQMLATDDLPAPVFQELIRSSSNVTTLDISKFVLNQGYIMSTLPLPLLTTFSLNSRWETDIRHLNHSTLNWPLTKLFLKNESSEMFTSWEPLLNAVSNFSATLTHLQLELPEVKGVQDQVYNVHLPLNLPNLSNLLLEMYNVACLDFLLPAKDSLRVFEVRIDLFRTQKLRALELLQKAETGLGQKIKFLSCQSGLESNVWTIFPNLTQVKFTLRAQIPLDYPGGTHLGKILGWCCSRQEWMKRENLSAF